MADEYDPAKAALFNKLIQEGLTEDAALAQAGISSADFGNYEFTGKNITPFNGFQIKIIMTGTNQSYVPLIRDLRAIASI